MVLVNLLRCLGGTYEEARMALGDLDGARVDLNAAAAANPTDRAVLQEIRRLEVRTEPRCAFELPIWQDLAKFIA